MSKEGKMYRCVYCTQICASAGILKSHETTCPHRRTRERDWETEKRTHSVRLAALHKRKDVDSSPFTTEDAMAARDIIMAKTGRLPNVIVLGDAAAKALGYPRGGTYIRCGVCGKVWRSCTTPDLVCADDVPDCPYCAKFKPPGGTRSTY